MFCRLTNAGTPASPLLTRRHIITAKLQLTHPQQVIARTHHLEWQK
jgi:hypothetical protein